MGGSSPLGADWPGSPAAGAATVSEAGVPDCSDLADAAGRGLGFAAGWRGFGLAAGTDSAFSEAALVADASAVFCAAAAPDAPTWEGL
ncbi:MAG TPA: hypothetical protein VII05_07870 [Gaiellaceae bacterium]